MSTVHSPEKPVALIAGPTASGKSDLAVKLAVALQDRGKRACVINADSAQVYADLQVLSARPSVEEMAGVPHHLFGTWDGAQGCSAADWAAAAKVEIAKAHASAIVPILVGGTGLYIRTLLDGIAPIPEIAGTIREEVRNLDPASAYAALQSEDPDRAAKLHAGDSQRIARALEVVRSTGRTLAQWQERLEGGIAQDVTLSPLILMPDREWLYARCDTRFEMMLEQGGVAEVEALLARDLPPDLPIMRAIGVPEIAALLRGQISREDAVTRGKQATRNYAKRQFTWLRHQPPEDWHRAAPDNVDLGAVYDILLRN